MFLFVKRYLLAKKSHSVVNIITTLSVVSISLPVAAVIVLLSVFNGFGNLLEETNRRIDPDMSVVLKRGNFFEVEGIEAEEIMAIEGVEALSMVLEQTMLLEHEGRQAVVTLRGVDSAFLNIVPLDESIVKGEYCVSLGELDRLVLGRSLAYRLGAHNLVDRYLDLYALNRSGFSSLLPMSNYQRRRIKLSGHFTADMESEERYAITSLRGAQQLTGRQGKASQLFVKLSPSANEQRVKEAIGAVVGDKFVVKNRYDLNPMLYDIVAFEKWGLLFISTLIMLLASFTLIGALSMLIIEKRDNIATLRAMGGSWSFVRGIFFGEGVMISAVGVGLGVVVGCGVTLLQQHFGLLAMPTQSFLTPHYPVELRLLDVVAVVTLSLSISLLLSRVVVRQMINVNAGR